MTYRLKNKVLWDALLANQANFQAYFDNQCEAAEASDGVIVARLVFTPDQVEKVKEYDPHDWNEFPDVTPPKDCPMLCEAEAKGEPVYYVAYFNAGQWRLHLNKFTVGAPRRFRPWENRA